MRKVLLDTDIGNDIDDAVCLAYLLAQPECELLGITTVSGEGERRAELASAICTAAGRRIPIFPGTETPLLTEPKQPCAPQADALGDWKRRTDFRQGEALAFLRDTIRANPGEITLLAIGPMTNVALLFAMDPEIPSLLKSLVLMCGVFTNRLASAGPIEWNANCDPYATAIVYRSSVTVHRSIGLDVTRQVTMSAKDVRRRFQVPVLAPVLDFAEVWFQERDQITFHDPLAAVTLFDNTICNFSRGHVEVELESSKLRGMTRWTEGEGEHEVALDVNSDGFFDHFFRVLKP